MLDHDTHPKLEFWNSVATDVNQTLLSFNFKVNTGPTLSYTPWTNSVADDSDGPVRWMATARGGFLGVLEWQWVFQQSNWYEGNDQDHMANIFFSKKSLPYGHDIERAPPISTSWNQRGDSNLVQTKMAASKYQLLQ